MTAGLLSSARPAKAGLRPVNPRKDLGQLAALLETAFGRGLDATGRQMVRDMRTLGRLGWVGWILSKLVLPPAAYPRGYVWEEAGEVIGNASLLRVAGHRRRWVLANVAVHPDHRRRGIGRDLVQAAVRMARDNGATELLLQVERDSPGALKMYVDLGFQSLAVRTTWLRRRGAFSDLSADPGPVRPRRKGEWWDQWALAQAMCPEGLIWPHPLSPSAFRPAGLSGALGLTAAQHWVWVEGSRMRGSLSARPAGDLRAWRIILLTDWESSGQVEAALLAQALAALPVRRSALVMDYPADLAVETLGAAGFRAERTLTWMAKAL